MFDFFDQIIGDPLIGDLWDPQKRVFWGYIVSGFVLAAVVQLLVLKKQSWTLFQKEALSRDIWWSKSARSDYVIFLINKIIMKGVGLHLISKMVVATFVFEGLHRVLEGRSLLLQSGPDWLVPVLFTVVLFLIDDASRYGLHRLLHRVPFLWAFHQVHHSAETMTPITVLRTHPVEGLLFSLRAIFVQAITIGVFFYFFGSRMELLTVFGANIIIFTFNLLGANLRHSHVSIGYGRFLEHIFISPAQHQIHHSVAEKHYDKNFGVVLALWDWWGGTLYLAKPDQKVTFGVAGQTYRDHRLLDIYIRPFQDALKTIRFRQNVKHAKQRNRNNAI